MQNVSLFTLPPPCSMVSLHLTICRKRVCLELSTVWLLANGKKLQAGGGALVGTCKTSCRYICIRVYIYIYMEVVCADSVVNLVEDLLGVWPPAILAMVIPRMLFACKGWLSAQLGVV